MDCSRLVCLAAALLVHLLERTVQATQLECVLHAACMNQHA